MAQPCGRRRPTESVESPGMTHSDTAVIAFAVGAVLAVVAAVWESPYSGRLHALALAAVAVGLAVWAS